MYEVTQLFWYKSVFMAEILLAEFLFTFRLKKKDCYPVRFTWRPCCAWRPRWPRPSWIQRPVQLRALFHPLCRVHRALMLCYREPFLHIFFCAVAAYTVQHIAFELYNFIVVATGLNAGCPWRCTARAPPVCPDCS